MSLASLPPAVSWPGVSFPPRGPWGRFPRFQGTTRRSESPPPVPPHFVAFARRYPGRTRCSLPRPPSASAEGLELVTRCSRRDIAEKMEGPPRFLENPKVNVPRSPTPAGSQAPGHGDAATRPSVAYKTSAPASFFISGLNRAARSLAVYASRRRLPGHHARLASGCWPSSAGRGSVPRRVPTRSFRDTIASSSPKLSWRTIER